MIVNDKIREMTEAIKVRRIEVAESCVLPVADQRATLIRSAANSVRAKLRAAFDPDWNFISPDSAFYRPAGLENFFEAGRKPRGVAFMFARKSQRICVQVSVGGIGAIFAHMSPEHIQKAAYLADLITFHFLSYRKNLYEWDDIFNGTSKEELTEAMKDCPLLHAALLEMELSLLNLEAICPWRIRTPKRATRVDRRLREEFEIGRAEINHKFEQLKPSLDYLYQARKDLALLKEQMTAVLRGPAPTYDIDSLSNRVASLEEKVATRSELLTMDDQVGRCVGRINVNIDALKKLQEIVTAIARRQDVLTSRLESSDKSLHELETNHNRVAKDVAELPVLLEELKKHLP
jgi:hypothetical protein